MSELSTPAAPTTDNRGRRRIAIWVALGVGTGLLIIIGLGSSYGSPSGSTGAVTPATALGVAALCYLAAAASQIRWVSWLAVPPASGLPFLAMILPVPWWLIMIIAGALISIIGLVRAPRPTLVQAAAMIGYFGVAVLGLFLAPAIGLAVAGLALALHPIWDVLHYRRNMVVNRSLAIWCIGVDLTVAGGCAVLALIG